MLVKTVKTRPFVPPKDDLFLFIKKSFSGLDLEEKSVIIIASKIVSIWQGRCLKIDSIRDKDDLIKKESDFYLDGKEISKDYVKLTIKDNTLIPMAGIDESNGGGYFILWPENPFRAAKQIYDFIKEDYHLDNFGIVISDSHCTPLRYGTTGISIAHYGFHPLKDYRGKKDIFGREIKIVQSNIADALATAAVLVMGEGDEQTPIVIIEDIDFIKFKESDPKEHNPLEIDKNNDIYAPLLKVIKWKKGR